MYYENNADFASPYEAKTKNQYNPYQANYAASYNNGGYGPANNNVNAGYQPYPYSNYNSNPMAPNMYPQQPQVYVVPAQQRYNNYGQGNQQYAYANNQNSDNTAMCAGLVACLSTMCCLCCMVDMIR